VGLHQEKVKEQLKKKLMQKGLTQKEVPTSDKRRINHKDPKNKLQNIKFQVYLFQ
jgi:hypothetical protein